MTTNIFYNFGEVSKQLNIKKYQLIYLLSQSIIREPKVRIGGRRMFSAHELQEAKVIIEKRKSLINQEKTNVNNN